MKEYGKTVSSTIPIVLSNFIKKEKYRHKDITIMLVSFGVKLSWKAKIYRILK